MWAGWVANRRGGQPLGIIERGRNVGYSGVTVWAPDGTLLNRIRLPEICGNICFGGPKRNRLFMAASQSIYSVFNGTQGAGPA
ncbi:gluconolactonase [Jannaschia faecimaris]|uniref:Gluconolactonase n=1 Tax=Jannaschia faecimaris TaxID=1244108 RepID=A0A1H3MJM8_9RHOB|nr:SMP-30/gluconolactonase/LRE family protein [Jannaschia faecimaris]SDY76514.1 gluconolactonase [Jannaschia faecimaris]